MPDPTPVPNPTPAQIDAMHKDIATAIGQLVQALTATPAKAVLILQKVQDTVSSALKNAHGSGEIDPKP